MPAGQQPLTVASTVSLTQNIMASCGDDLSEDGGSELFAGDGQVDGDNASTWAVNPKSLPAAAFVRFRIHLAEPADSNPGSVIDELIFHYRYPVE